MEPAQNVWHHWQTGKKTPKADGVFHPEEWQATVHEQTYDANQAQRFRVGFFRLEHVRFCQRVAQRGRYAGDERQGAGLLRP